MFDWIIWLGFIAFSANHDALNIYRNSIEKKGNLKHLYRALLRGIFALMLVSGGALQFDFSYVVVLFMDALPFYLVFWILFDPLLTLRRMHYSHDFRPRKGIFYAGKDIWELGFMPWYLRYAFKIGLLIAVKYTL